MHNDESNTVNSQLDKLEKISNQISLMISEGQFEKINHLDKLRKKIITDMNEKNYDYTNHRKTVLKLISQNEKIISEFKESQGNSLSMITKNKKCTEAYLATF